MQQKIALRHIFRFRFAAACSRRAAFRDLCPGIFPQPILPRLLVIHRDHILSVICMTAQKGVFRKIFRKILKK